MEELLANLNTADPPPIFDTSSILGSAFDMDPGFVSDANENASIYPPDLSASLRNQHPASASASQPSQGMQISPAEDDYLAVDDGEAPSANSPSMKNPNKPMSAAASAGSIPKQEQDSAMVIDIPSISQMSAATSAALSGITPTPPTNTQASVNSSTALETSVRPVVPDKPPDTPATIERRRLAPLADAVVREFWCSNRKPADFVAAVKKRLPIRRDQTQSIVEESAAPKSEPSKEGSEGEIDGDPSQVRWQLPEPSEGALLDALCSCLVKCSAVSTRLMSYLTNSLITGIVSQHAVIATCLKWIVATPDISTRVLQAFASLMAQIIPHYRFSPTDNDLTAEVKDFLSAFTMIIRSAARTPSFAPQLASVLGHDRVVALVRACARRIPSEWIHIDAAIAELEVPPKEDLSIMQDAFPPRCAYDEAPELIKLVPRLKKGLCVGIISFEEFTKDVPFDVPGPGASLSKAITAAYDTLLLFGREMSKAVRDMLSQKEGPRGDYPLLVALEQAATSSQSDDAARKDDFRKKAIACQAIVRFLSQRASKSGSGDNWKGLWGGKERLKRIIRDAIPQVKSEIKSESGALLVSVVVVAVAAMILGPSLCVEDTNDGRDINDPTAASEQESQNEEVEEAMGELTGFAVGILEEAATAEEVPAWRSFGLWLLLLMSRCGSMLRASGCEHVRAARVLRAWGGIPTGTPGSHIAATSGKQSSQSGSGHHQAPSSSSAAARTEGVAMFATSASLAIIDASDISGSDETIRALCDDLVQ